MNIWWNVMGVLIGYMDYLQELNHSLYVPMVPHIVMTLCCMEGVHPIVMSWHYVCRGCPHPIVMSWQCVCGGCPHPIVMSWQCVCGGCPHPIVMSWHYVCGGCPLHCDVMTLYVWRMSTPLWCHDIICVEGVHFIVMHDIMCKKSVLVDWHANTNIDIIKHCYTTCPQPWVYNSQMCT